MDNNTHAQNTPNIPNSHTAGPNGFVENNHNAGSFPSDDETQLKHISPLLGNAPVLQQTSTAPFTTESGIASQDDFAEAQEARPFARKIGPKTLAASGIAVLIILPLSIIFTGGSDSPKQDGTTAVELESGGEEGTISISAEVYEAQQAEIEQLRSQQAFLNQQIDAEAIDAAGRARQQQAAAQPAKSTPTASKPTPTTTTARPTSVTVRPTPTKPVAAAPVRRATPAPASASTPRSVTTTTGRIQTQAPAEPEAVDPFERRAQLQTLGSYGAPPPAAISASRRSYQDAVNPFDLQTPYIQTIALERPQAHSAVSRQIEQTPSTNTTVLSEADFQYRRDAEAVLGGDETQAETTEEGVDATPEIVPSEESSPVSLAQPLAIMPGTSADAELPYGFTWQQGTPLPEVLLMTTEDIMAGELTVIPAETQFLGQAQIDPSSGAVTIDVVGMFGETRDIQIPRTSVIVQTEDGSVLTAKASRDLSANASGANTSGFLMESLGNGLGNVINSDDSLLTDLAGGMAETLIENQLAQADAEAANRASRAAATPILWTLNARPVKLTFNHFIPLPQVTTP